MSTLRAALVVVLLSLPTPALGAGGGTAKGGDRDHDGASNEEERRLGLDPDVVNIPEPRLSYTY